MKTFPFLAILFLPMFTQAQSSATVPPIEPGVSHELAKWRAARYSDVRYKLNLTLEKMSPVLKGTMEIRVKMSEPPASAGGHSAAKAETRPVGSVPSDIPIILDWRKIRGHEEKSAISNVSINGTGLVRSSSFSWPPVGSEASPGGDGPPKGGTPSFAEHNEHLIFTDGVVAGENVIKLDFTSPILTSGSAITRYVDKEDGSEYIYSLFVPSDASTAFPVFDQPDIKARFELSVTAPTGWSVISNSEFIALDNLTSLIKLPEKYSVVNRFPETKPISTYVFAFAAGPFEKIDAQGRNLSGSEGAPSPGDTSGQQSTLPTSRVSASGSEPPAVAGGLTRRANHVVTGSGKLTPHFTPTNDIQPPATAGGSDKNGDVAPSIYVRKSQAAKFKPHAAEVFRLNREANKYFEEYFDYKFPFPKYDLVLIPEFPFGGMEHAGATFLRESAIIFPQEPTKNDHISRALLIFHEAAHQWFGDTVTMRWFDDLWLKEGFATFTAYKAMERIMPEMNAWKVFYERVKQAAYQTDSTKGTTPIYQEILNLSAAKSAYGNIVYNKAPAFLRQAEFYLGEDKFRTAVRSFLKKHEFKNAGWEDLIMELNRVHDRQGFPEMARYWVTTNGVPIIRVGITKGHYEKSSRVRPDGSWISSSWIVPALGLTLPKTFEDSPWGLRVKTLYRYGVEEEIQESLVSGNPWTNQLPRLIDKNDNFDRNHPWPDLIFPNYGDYGYGIFLLDEKSRDYVLKNIQNEKDPFLRSMMWGALWDSVREGELDPREYVELVVRVQSSNFSLSPAGKETSAGSGGQAKACTLNCDDESTTALLLSRVGTAMNYYLSDADRAKFAPRFEALLLELLSNAQSSGAAITYYRAFVGNAQSDKGRAELKRILATQSIEPRKNRTDKYTGIHLRTKDRFDIVTRLLILNDPDAPKLLAELEKTETGDDAKRYAYAARAGIGTAENKAKYWNDFVNNKEISESWIEAAFGPWNSIRHSELTLPYLQKALKELPTHKRNRKIFFVNGWLGAFIGGQRSEAALAIVNKFLADNPNLDKDLRLKILENVDVIERAVKIRAKNKD